MCSYSFLKQSSFSLILTRWGIILMLSAAGLGILPPLLAAATGITVNSAADTMIAGDNQCTLREAIANANSDSDVTNGDCAPGNGDDVIGFAPALLGQTITLSGTELSISSNITINGPGAKQLTISGANASRVFNIIAGVVNITGVTIRDGRAVSANGGGVSNAGTLILDNSAVISNAIAGGNATEGGGVYNTGVITIAHSAILSNTSLGSSGRGGGISSFGGKTTVVNTTISANTAQSSGGGVLADGELSLINSTIVNNRAVNLTGGGIFRANGAIAVKNTIIANNADSGGANDCDYLFVKPVSQGYNLVENTGRCTFTGAGDIAGQDPNLAPLAYNDGDTLNHAPLAGSAAIDQIPAGVNGCGDDVTRDQRDYLRAAGKPCDIGATEYNGIKITMAKWVDDTTAGPTQMLTYTAVITLWPSGNVSLTNALIADTMPNGVNFVGPVNVLGGSGGATGTPPALVSGLTVSGGETVTVTFPITIGVGLPAGTVITNTAQISSFEVLTPVGAAVALTVNNVAPIAVDDTPSVLEDSGANTLAVLTNDYDLNGDAITITAISDGSPHSPFTIDHSQLTINYTPTLHFNGTDVFTYAVADGNLGDTATVTVTVAPVNDAPSFTKGAGQWAIQRAGAQTVTAWATAISAGPPNEGSQTLSFDVSAGNPALFAVQPALDAASGDLTYEPAVAQSGATSVTVILGDNGGTANGGNDASPPQTFTLSILPGDVTTSIDPVTGGSLTYVGENGTMVFPNTSVTTTIQVPGGAVTGVIDLVYDELPSSAPLPPAGFVFAGRIFTLEAYQNAVLQAGYVFKAPITLTLSYNPAELGFVDEDSLTLRTWNDETWAEDGVTVVGRDLANHTVTARIAHLSQFALFGQTPALNIHKSAAGAGGGAANLPLSQMVTYTIVLSNGGGATAHGVVMSDTLPPGVNFANWVAQGSATLPASGNVVEWGPYDIAAGRAYTIQFSAGITYAHAFAGKTITNTATFASGDAGSGAGSAIFTVASNTPPAISAIANQITYAGIPSVITFTVSDLETPLDMLALSGQAPNPALITDTNIVFSGGGANRTVTITPTTGIAGTSAVTVSVTDGGGLSDETVFHLTAVRYFIYLPLVMR